VLIFLKLFKLATDQRYRDILLRHALEDLERFLKKLPDHIGYIKEECFLLPLRLPIFTDDPPTITFWCLSLGTPERSKIIDTNLLVIPSLIIRRSINGYDCELTEKALSESGLILLSLDHGFSTYGTLACFLSKYFALKEQVDQKIEYLCLLEDDCYLCDNFEDHVRNLTLLFRLRRNLNLVRLGRWGEGYIFSLKGATDALKRIQKTGIIANIDNQFRLHSGPEVSVWRHTPWKLAVPTNSGDILKTKKLVIK
jgi:hypothetical protein